MAYVQVPKDLTKVKNKVMFNLARQLNNNITAWLSCPDTVIDYPVCHGDDNSYYLTHLVDGTYNCNG